MTRFLSFSSVGLALAVGACGPEHSNGGLDGSGGSAGPGGSGASQPVAGAASGGGFPNTAGATASSAGTAGNAGSAAVVNGGGGGVAASGSSSGGSVGSSGSAGASGGAEPVALPPLVTSAPGAYWKTGSVFSESTTSTADVTVNDTVVAQKWDGFGAAFNEQGWAALTSSELQTQAMNLLFSASDGAAFTWGRIPIGANDFALSRYTEDDTGADVAPDSAETNRPVADTTLNLFSLVRDDEKLVPYVKAAQAVKTRSSFLGQSLDTPGLDEDWLPQNRRLGGRQKALVFRRRQHAE